jgi:hypothetical protein
MSLWCSVAIALLLQFMPVVQTAFLEEPFVKWTYQIPGSGSIGSRGFRKGNAIVISRDESRLFATADDGSLHIINPDNGPEGEALVYQPESVAGAYTECRSGVALSESTGTIFAVYAVVDTPNSFGVPYDGLEAADASKVVTSRVLAVNSSGSLRWSVSLNGYVSGTPVVGANGVTVYVSHNVPTENGDYRGKLTVISDNDGDPLIGDGSPSSDQGTYGPLAIQTDALGRDQVLWAESRGDGYESGSGRVYSLSQAEPGSGEFSFTTFSSWDVPSVTRPTISRDLSGVWFGGFRSTLAGWTGSVGTDTELDPVWQDSLPPSERNASQRKFGSVYRFGMCFWPTLTVNQHFVSTAGFACSFE